MDYEKQYRETLEVMFMLKQRIRRGRLVLPLSWYLKDLAALEKKLEEIERRV